MGAPRTGDSPAVRDYRSYCVCWLGARARFFLFFFNFFKGVAFNIITLRGLVGIYTIKLSVKRGKDKGGGLMERHRVRATLFIRWAMMGGKFGTRRDGPDDSKVRLLAHSLVAYYNILCFFFSNLFQRMSDVGCTPIGGREKKDSRKYSSLLIVRLLQTFYLTLRLSLSIAVFRP